METKKIFEFTVVAMVAALLTVTTTGLLIADQRVPLSGTIQTTNVGVYNDNYCTQNCTAIEVGVLNPGEVFNHTVYVKNTGTTAVSLSLSVDSWDPVEAGSWLALSWNRADYVLGVGEIVQATLTLSVDAGIEGVSDFGFDARFVGTQIE